MAISLVALSCFSFAQENDWIEYSGSDIIVYSPDRSYGIVIQDRNLWATMTWYGWKSAATWSYGYHYQWWNNHWFETCYTLFCNSFPGWETTSKTQVDTSGYWPDNPYSGNTFIKVQGDWSSVNNENLRWWTWDNETNWYGLTSHNPLTGRQWPCPEWYHIPSMWELNELRIIWYNNKYDANLAVGDLVFLRSNTQIDQEFSKDLLAPYAWGRDYDWDSWVLAEISWYTSTPAFIEGYIGKAYFLNLYRDSSSHIHMAFEMPRTMAYPIRCFKDEKIINNPDAITVKFNANWWDSITTWSVEVALGDTLDISVFSWTKEGWVFVWWHTNPWESVPMVDPVIRWPITLYAIFEKGLTVTYLSWEEITSIWADSDSCLMNKEEMWCNVVAPSITTSRTGYSGIWSNWNVVVKPWDYITLTGDDTYTASITPNTYIVKFNKNGWQWSMKNQTFTYDTPQKLTWNTFTKSWYIFSGWTYGGVSYKDKQLVNNLTTVNNQSITFTAQWKVDPGYIVYWPFYTNNGDEFMIAVSTSDWTINTGVTIDENPSYTESKLLEILWNDLEHTSAEIVDIEDLGGDVLFLKSPEWTGYITKWFCSTAWCSYFETSGSENVTDEFKNQAMDTPNVQWPTWAVSANDYVKYNEVWSGWFVVLVKDGDVDGYVYVPIKKYTVTWNDSDWSNLRTDVNVKYGTMPSYGSIPEKPEDDAYTYGFSGWNPGISVVVWDVTYTAEYTPTPKRYSIRFVLWNGEADILITWNYGSTINIPANPTREWYSFDGWDWEIPATMPAENKIIYAKWTKVDEKPSGWSSWWGSSRRWNPKTADSQTDAHWSADDEEPGYDSDNDDLDGLEVIDYNPDLPAEQQTLSDGLTPEMHRAYKWAYKNGITTMHTILEADMYGPLDRISMAKMLSQYAINILWLTPDTNRINQFTDVTPEMDAEFNNWVTLAYQLWIMWINMHNNEFRPFDSVPRSEFGTALSRMLYKLSDWEYERTDEFYIPHFNKLQKELIMTVLDPNIEELRWYVMIMLMRAAE